MIRPIYDIQRLTTNPKHDLKLYFFQDKLFKKQGDHEINPVAGKKVYEIFHGHVPNEMSPEYALYFSVTRADDEDPEQSPSAIWELYQYSG